MTTVVNFLRKVVPKEITSDTFFVYSKEYPTVAIITHFVKCKVNLTYYFCST